MSQRPPQRSTSRSGARSGARRSAPSRSSREARRRKQLRRRRSAIVAVALASILLLVIGTAFIYGMSLWNKIDFKTRDDFTLLNSVPLNENEFVSENTIENMAGVDFGTGEIRSDSQIRNILLIGADADSGGYGRSDSMLLVSIDDKTGTLKLTSFLRDTYLKIPGQQDNRLNAAYAIGGPALLMETIEQNFRIRIDNYVKVDFDTFPQVINTLGGVTIELTQREADHLNEQFGAGAFCAGDNPMNGEQALAYARIRKLDSDFGRTQRQRNVIEALIYKFRTSNVGTMLSVLEQLLPLIQTDIPGGDRLSLVTRAPQILQYPVEQMSVPGTSSFTNEVIRNMAVLVPDMEQNKTDLWEFIYGEA